MSHSTVMRLNLSFVQQEELSNCARTLALQCATKVRTRRPPSQNHCIHYPRAVHKSGLTRVYPPGSIISSNPVEERSNRLGTDSWIALHYDQWLYLISALLPSTNSNILVPLITVYSLLYWAIVVLPFVHFK